MIKQTNQLDKIEAMLQQVIERLAAGPKLLLTEREAAESLSISDRKLWQLRTDGQIPFVQMGGNVRYQVDELQAWARGQRIINQKG